jgi:hypothetical protein
MSTLQNEELLKHHPKYLEQVMRQRHRGGTRQLSRRQDRQHGGRPGVSRRSTPIGNIGRSTMSSRGLPLRIAFDFNVDPMTAVDRPAVGRTAPARNMARSTRWRCPSSTVDQMCDELIKRAFPRHRRRRCGLRRCDRRGAQPAKDLRSNYQIIEEKLRRPWAPLVDQACRTINPPGDAAAELGESPLP